MAERRDNILDVRRPGLTARHERGQTDYGVDSHVQSRPFDVIGRRAAGGFQGSRITRDGAFEPFRGGRSVGVGVRGPPLGGPRTQNVSAELGEADQMEGEILEPAQQVPQFGFVIDQGDDRSSPDKTRSGDRRGLLPSTARIHRAG